MTEVNIENLIKAIKEFGFGDLQLSLKDFMNPENIVQLGYEPYRIDLLVDIEGVDFEECYERRTGRAFTSLESLLFCKDISLSLKDKK